MQPSNLPIGIVEDDAIIGGTLAHRLEIEGYRPILWESGEAALEAIAVERPRAVVCDIRLPGLSGEELFLRSLPLIGRTPFVFVTAFGDIDQAVRLTKAGAVDYITKPYVLGELLARLERLVATPGPERAGGALGHASAMRRIELLLARVADIDSIVLLTGESGVGKEVAARHLHRISARAQAPFFAVNCAAIPSELIESELFGHEKGAFTGAAQRHAGYVERARDGVLFLDEVGELPIAVQAKLLRLIQDRSYMRVGGEDALHCKARFVFATNVDLAKAVEAGHFRRDLFYRINVIDVAIPPLRDRREDILPLARLFLREFSDAFARPLEGFEPGAEALMLNHGWPGNVRELRNRIERAVALAEGPRLATIDLFPGETVTSAKPPTLAEVREAAERRHISEVLASTRGDAIRAATLLGISRSTFFEKIRRLGIDHHAP